MKPRVFIGLPNLGDIRTELVLTLLHWFTSGKYVLKFFAPMYIQPLHRARNVCLHAFLQEEYDWLFLLEADCAPPVHTLDRLLQYREDFVAATILTWRDGGPIPVAFRWSEEKGGYVPHYGHGLTEVDIATLGCAVLSRRLVEHAVARYRAPFDWEDNETGTDGYSEDFVFCRRAKELGYRIYCDYGLLVGHRKPVELLEVNKALAEVMR